MAIERIGTSSLIDVLDRVLDKGIVIDAWVRVSVAGIDLIANSTTVEAPAAETSARLVGRRLPIRRGPPLSA